MELNTAENFLLLAHHPEKKRFIIQDSQLTYGLIGALLLEMSINEQIDIDGKLLILKSRKSDSNSVINEMISTIKESQKDRRIRYWISKFSRKSNRFKWSIIETMEKKRLMRIEYKKFLGLIPYRLCILLEQKPRNQLIRDLNKDALRGKEISSKNLVMLGMVEACKMHRIIASDKEETKRLRKALKIIIKENPIASTVDKTIKEVQAAVVAAVIASTVATTSATS